MFPAQIVGDFMEKLAVSVHEAIGIQERVRATGRFFKSWGEPVILQILKDFKSKLKR